MSATNNIKAFTTLKSVIANILLDDPDMGKYMKYAAYAARILRELNVFHIRTYTTVRLPMSDIKTVALPDDYQSFVSLGIPVNGRLWMFTKDNKLIVPASEDCGELVLDSTEGEGVVIGAGHLLSGYGLPGGRNDYYYKIDLPNWRIIINGFPRASVTLTYIGTGIKVNEETLIPRIAEEALIAGIQMLIDRRDRSVPMSQKAMSQQIYDQECEKLNYIQGSTINEIYDAIAETYYQSVKR